METLAREVILSAEVDGTDWRLPVGEVLDLERAGVIVDTFAAEVRRVGRETAARIRAEQPGLKVDGRIYSASDITGYRRDPEATGIQLAAIWHDHAGAIRVVPIGVNWETGEVRALGEGGRGRGK